MRRVVSSSIISVIILLFLAGAIFYFQYFKRSESNVLNSVPADVAWLISCSPHSGQMGQLATSAFFTGHDSIEPLRTWYKGLMYFDSISQIESGWKEIFQEERLYVSAHVTGPSAFGLIFYRKASGQQSESELNKLMMRLLSVNQASIERKNFEGAEIYHARKGERSFTWTLSRGIFIGSQTPYLVEDALRRQRSRESADSFSDLGAYLEGTDDKLLLALRYSGFHKWLNTQLGAEFQNPVRSLQRIGEWTIGRIEVKRNLLKMEGVTTLSDSSQFLTVFADQMPVQVDLPAALSRRTAAFISWRFSDTERFLEAHERFMKRIGEREGGSTLLRQSLIPFFRPWIGSHLSLVYTQTGTAQSEAGFYALIGIRDSLSCTKMLEALQKKYQDEPKPFVYENYNGYRIGLVNGTAILPSAFGSLFNKMNRFYFAIAGKNLVIANQASALRAYLNDLKSGSVLSKEEAFKVMNSEVPDKTNLLFYSHLPESESLFRTVASPAWSAWLSRYSSSLRNWNGMLFSVTQKDGIFQTLALLSHTGKHTVQPAVLWSYSLPASPVYGPALAGTTYPYWFIQDSALVLHALKADGTEAWERKLESAIQGSIHSVQVYRPGSQQLAFTTRNFLYVIDSTGLNQGNFPLRLPASTQTGLALSSETTGERTTFYVACTNLQLYAYQADGRPLPGFQSARLPAQLTQAPLVAGDLLNRSIWLSLADSSALWLKEPGGVKTKMNIKVRGTAIFPSSKGQGFVWLSRDGKIMETDSSGKNSVVLSPGADTIINFLPLELNGDGREDLIYSFTGGIRAQTGEGISLFLKRHGNLQNKTLKVLQIEENRYFLYDDSNRGEIYMIGEDGKPSEGFPLRGQPPLIPWKNGFLYASDSLTWSFCRYQ